MRIRNLQYDDETGKFSGFVVINGREVAVNGTYVEIDFHGGIYSLGDRVIKSVTMRPTSGAPETTVYWSEDRAVGLHRWHGVFTEWGRKAEKLLNRNEVGPLLLRRR